MNNLGKRNLFNRFISFICITIMISSILIIAIASSYTVLIEDDYWHGNDVGAFHVGFWNYLIASLKYAKNMYLNWQGTYFSMFLQALLSPVNNYGMPQLRAVMIFNTLNFFISLIGFTWISLNRLIKDEHLFKLIICTCIVFVMTAYSTFEEVFFWFSGTTSYSFPVSCLFYSLIFISLYSDGTVCHSKIRKCILGVSAIVLGLCAMGGSLTVAATGCCFLLLLCIYRFLSHKKIEHYYLLFFASYFLSAIINTASPGNFIRQTTSDGEGLQIITSIKYTYVVYESNLRWLFSKTNFPIVFLTIMICGMFMYKKININLRTYTIVGLFSIIVPFIVIFPVVLGYNLPWIPNRCVFIVLISMAFVFCNLALIAGYWVTEIVSEKNRTLIAVMTVLLMFVTVSVNTYTTSDYSSKNVFIELLNGTIPGYYAQYVDMLHYFEESQGTNLIVDQSHIPEAIENFYCFDLSDDVDSRTNRAIANVYNLDSIAKKAE